MSSTLRRLGGITLVLSLATCSSSAPAPRQSAPPVSTVSATTAAAVGAGVAPIATTPDGVPRLVRAVTALPAPAGASPEQAARFHLRALAPIYGAPVGRADDAATAGVIPLRGGAHAVLLRQQFAGVPVLGGDVRVLLDRDGGLSAIAGTLVARPPVRPTFTLSATDAVRAAITAEYGVAVAPTAGTARGAWTPVRVPAAGGLVVSESDVRRVIAADGSALVAAYQVEMFATPASGSEDALRFVIAADGGKLLERTDLSADDTFIYRTWADPTGERRPLEGPIQSTMPHPTGVPDGFFPAFVAPNLVAVESLDGLNDPWLPPASTETIGNNVEAYTDSNAPDGLTTGDFRANVSGANAFDYAYDLGQAPMANTTQQKGSVVALFYLCNWLHDWYYDSGFVEAAGNAQDSNYGRGGEEADSIKAEAQDNAIAGNRNNANMSTPSDGLRPRMQMYLWSGINARSITLNDGTVIGSNTAAFGATNFDFTDDVSLAADGVGTVTDACEALSGVAGRIVLADRGGCPFTLKAAQAQAAGAVGLIIANNTPGVAAPGLGGVDPTITIPVLSTTMEAGTDLKARLQAGPVTAHMYRLTGLEQDGAFDTTVTGHEWGHYLHHRLSNCGTHQCGGLSEGWGDFVGLHLQLRPGDDWTKTFALGAYATRGLSFPNSAYFGIRRFPYSIDPTKSPLTFRHIQRGEPLPTGIPMGSIGAADMDEVHNAGEIWAAMLWDVYVALLEEHGYADARRRMSDYVVAGLLATPIDATYTDARDGILAAVSTLDPTDLAIVAGGFAVRGNGSCAVAPPAASADNVGVVESNVLAGRILVGGLTLTDDGFSCDGDDYLDPGETGTLRVTVANGGPVPLTAITVAVTSADPDLEVLGTGAVASLAAYSSAVVSIPVALDPTAPADGTYDLTVTTTATGGCTPSLVATLTGRTGLDETTATSATDDVEAQVSPWTAGGTITGVWDRSADASLGHFLYGRDFGTSSDTFLASPALDVSATAPFSVTLQHAYSFEASGGTLFDGGMIEVSTDGTTWVDATTLTTTPIPYTGALGTASENPLGGRQAFSQTNAAFPARDTLTLDFGTALAGETVQLRFRIGTDGGVGAYGWEIDDLAFSGIDNTPFGEVVADGPTCQLAPIANAGPDQNVPTSASVQLDGSASADPNGEPITYAWTQVAGASVTISNPGAAAPTFTAPGASGTLTFQLAVSDVFATTSDTVDIVVAVGPVADAALPDAAPIPDAALPPDAAETPDAAGSPDARPSPDAASPPDDDEGGCCRVNDRGGATGTVLLMAVVAFALRRRRRR